MSPVLFVYGTLMPGQPRWDLLRRYAADPGWVARAAGQLFDTGQGYPTAQFDTTRFNTAQSTPAGTHITGYCIPLLEASSSLALAELDRYEEVDLGLYSRIRITTSNPAGTLCWAYTLGPAGPAQFPEMQPIHSGDWAAHRARCT